MRTIDKKLFTLCIIHQPPRVLLGMKKIKFGKGKWNGFGGHVEEGEMIDDAARREMKEEAGIVIEEMEKAGVNEVLYLNADAGEMKEIEIHIFRVTRFSGVPAESDEMRPEWFDTNNLPWDSMWPSDPGWYPFFLKGKKFKGTLVYEDFDTLKSATYN